jgi:hypothetical protein
MTEEKQKRGRTSKRTLRVSPIVEQSVAAIKQKEAQALEAALQTTDGAKAELLRAMAIAYDHSAKLVLACFDAISRKPQL